MEMYRYEVRCQHFYYIFISISGTITKSNEIVTAAHCVEQVTTDAARQHHYEIRGTTFM